MKKVFQRLLVFFISMPLLIIILICLPWLNHLAFSIVVLTVSVLGALEVQNILKQKGLLIPAPEAAVVGSLGPVFAILQVNLGLNGDLAVLLFCLGAAWVLFSRVFSRHDKLDGYINYSAAGLTVLIYPGFLMGWIIRMGLFPNAGITILVYLLISFLNDAAAWAAGMLFGKNNRGIVDASPNKSVAGFIGGTAVSIIIGIGACYVFPGVFGSSVIPAPLAGAFLGLACGIAATLGDLGESAIKRSAKVKDSGQLIPGRGGMLDSIDSLALAAPVYYLVFSLLFIRS
ncbi:MAG: phosphatidate cytidylyltransferase [Treponema sp.]|jgi:phosphatidate cytidylyltransferase|nr:phosphatidate cytidylyltransferase [Treponema sp.]